MSFADANKEYNGNQAITETVSGETYPAFRILKILKPRKRRALTARLQAVKLSISKPHLDISKMGLKKTYEQY